MANWFYYCLIYGLSTDLCAHRINRLQVKGEVKGELKGKVKGEVRFQLAKISAVETMIWIQAT